MSGRCLSCKYWDRDGMGLEETLFGYCGKAAQSSIHKGTDFSLAYAVLKLGDDAKLLTRYDFGCIQYEDKE